MPSEQDILGLLTGSLPADQRSRGAKELARDPEAARRAFGAERLAALAVLLGHAGSPVSPPVSPPAVQCPPQPPSPVMSADDVLRDALRAAGADGWAYRPAKGTPAPGMASVVCGAVREWSGTWHARLLLLAGGFALAYAAFALLKSGPLLMSPPATDNVPAGIPTNAPPAAPVPAPTR
jgi:hypothetical protein